VGDEDSLISGASTSVECFLSQPLSVVEPPLDLRKIRSEQWNLP
jgi:hypothetical protein